MTIFAELCLVSLLLIGTFTPTIQGNRNRHYSFEIDYENDRFLLDGKPLQFVSGSVHYFRFPKQYWKSVLRKVRAAGLNAVTTYVEWSTHEPEPGTWFWDGEADVVEFIKMAQEEDLLVILRPGPYICGERDFGGLPYWLLTLNPNILIRTNDPIFIFYATRYLNEILKKVKPLLIGNGGPIIMLQVENEYGSLTLCDSEYKRKLYDVFHEYVGNDAVLFTVDGFNSHTLNCGTVPHVYQTIDFGCFENIDKMFNLFRKYSPKGPFVNGEYYTGWLTHWGEPFRGAPTNELMVGLEQMLARNASINLYMFYGGTNFGFTSGANHDTKSLRPQITSYDYDAPLNEAGDPTPKYFKLRDVLSKYLPLPDYEVPAATAKANYGTVEMVSMLNFFADESRESFGSWKGVYDVPPTFEYLRLPHWLVLYELVLVPMNNTMNYHLEAYVKDRALVYVNDKLRGVLSNSIFNKGLYIHEDEITSIKVLVENQGRINYGIHGIKDIKGMFNVRLNNATLAPWNVTGFKLTSLEAGSFTGKNTTSETGDLLYGPQYLVGYFEVGAEPRDTYLNTKYWGKGVAYVNGRNLGRYWPVRGPQLTLYVPAPFLQKGRNSLVLIELEHVPRNRTISFQAYPMLDEYDGHERRR